VYINNNTLFYLNIFKHMVHEELLVFKKTFLEQCINMVIWLFCSLIISSYFLTSSFETTANFASFMLASCVGTLGLFESYPAVFRLVSDFEEEQSISSYLILPIPSWMVIVKIMTYIALRAAVFSLLTLPIGLMFIWSQFDISAVSWVKLISIILFSSAFYGTLTLWTTSYVQSTANLETVWIRFIFPLWFLGGFQYSWSMLYAINKPIAYLSLINPIIYIMEGCRAALLGSSNGTPFWACMSALALFTLVGSWQALTRIKKRLDYV
jgi:ABC-2 type transport system permease protein